MKKLITATTLCAVLLVGVMTPAAAACSRPAQQERNTEILNVIIQLVRQIKAGECCTITLPTEPTAPTEPVNPTQPTLPAEPTEPSAPEEPAPTDAVRAYELKVIELVNDIREANGLNPLTENTALSDVARVKSQDMRSNGYFDHTSPTYGSPFDMMRAFGITYRTAGENIAMGYRTAELVVEGWMNSQGHRENILKAGYTEIGVGYVASGHYCTQMFIGS